MATKSVPLHYSTQADMLAAQEYFDKNGTLAGFMSPSGNYDANDWLRNPAAAAYAGSDGIFQPEEEQRLLDASWAVWGGKPKEVSNLTKAGQGIVRVAKIIPGPHQAALNVADQMMGGKLSGHAISKNPFINAMAGAAGGAAGYALGTSESTSMMNAAKSGARMQLQDQMGLQPYARQGLGQLKDGWNVPDKQLDPNGVYGGSYPNGEYAGPQIDPTTGERATPSNMGDYWQGVGEAGESLNAGGVPITEQNSMDWMERNYPGSTTGSGYDTATGQKLPGGIGNSVPSGTTTGGSGGAGTGTGAGGGSGSASGGGNNLFAMAALGLLGDALKKDDKANVPAPSNLPYGGTGGMMPKYSDLGLITNAQVVDDQRRRLAAKRIA